MKKKILLITPNLNGGGAERVILTLLKNFDLDKVKPILMVINLEGALVNQIPKNIQIINLNKKRIRNSVISMIREINRIKPDGIMTILTRLNITLLAIKPFLKGKPRIIVRETSLPSQKFGKKFKLLYRTFYPRADKVIAISKGVAKDLISFANLDENIIEVIYNPVDLELIKHKAEEKIKHKWLVRKTIPVVVGIGRLIPAKDFNALIKAIKIVNKTTPCRLLILGEGPEQENLIEKIKEYGLESKVCLTGFMENPYPYLKQSDLFVLSSRWEGFGLVIVESLLLNTPVVSTDCPGAPKEILEKGNYGMLVGVNDIHAMAEAILKSIKYNTSPNTEKGYNRAKDFDSVKITQQYRQVILKDR